MQPIKYMLVVALVALGLAVIAGQAQAVTYRITFNTPPLIRCDNKVKSIHKSKCALDANPTRSFGVDFKAFTVDDDWFLPNDAKNEFNFGVRVENPHNSNRSFEISDWGDTSTTYSQAKAVFKKATDNGFVYDRGIYGSYYEEKSFNVKAAVSAGQSYTW